MKIIDCTSITHKVSRAQILWPNILKYFRKNKRVKSALPNTQHKAQKLFFFAKLTILKNPVVQGPFKNEVTANIVFLKLPPPP